MTQSSTSSSVESPGLVKVEVTGKDANYLRTQLKKRIDARDLNAKIEVSVVNNIAYLEKM